MKSKWIYCLIESMFVVVSLLAAMSISILSPAWGANQPVSLTISAHQLTVSANGHGYIGSVQLWSVTTTNEQVIKDMNFKISALPPAPNRKRWHCPCDDGSYYELVFRYTDGTKTCINIQRAGCRFVTFQDNKHQILWASGCDSLYRKLQTFRPAGSPDFNFARSF